MLTELNTDAFRARYMDQADDGKFASIMEGVPMQKGDMTLTNQVPKPINGSLTRDRLGETLPILFEDTKGNALGCASFSIWDAQAVLNLGLQAENSSQKLGYLGDLRFRSDIPRAVRLTWRQAYRALLEDCLERGIDGIVTSVLDENKIAVQSFLSGRAGIVYEPLIKYTTFSFLLEGEVDTPSVMNGEPYWFRTDIQRSWLVNGAQQLSVFSLSELDSLCTGFSKNLCQNIFRDAFDIKNKTGRQVFQIAVLADKENEFVAQIPNGLTYWRTPATIYRVKIGDERFPFQRVPGALVIDPCQL